MQKRNISYCKKCLMPNSRPRVVFDNNQYCNACSNADDKIKIDWKSRQEEFLEIINIHKKNDGYDCIVPWSGGKDSSSIAWKLKYEYGLNPLLVTFSPMLPNEVGNYNRESMINAGFDSLFFRPNQKVQKSLAKRFFIERGNPKVAWDAGINAVPVQVALKYDIKLIFYAEHGESEYGGKVIDNESTKKRNFTEVIEHQIGDDPNNWTTDEIDEKDLNPYIYPDIEEINEQNIQAYYFSYFNKWSMFENYEYIKNKISFKTHKDGRTPGTFTNFDSLDDKFDDIYYYMQYIKFGFGRCVRDVSRFIQNQHMTREEGLELCKLYDGEFPESNIKEIIDYLNMSEKDFYLTIDRHRNEEIWKKNNSNTNEQYELVAPLE